MPSVSMSGDDTIIIAQGNSTRVLADLPDGNPVELTFPNSIANVKTGKNGNSIYGLNASGRQCDVKLRVLRGSPDDKWLNNILETQNGNFAGMVLLNGQFIKKIGDGAGNIGSDTYVLSGGIFEKRVEGKMNVEGDTEQSVAEYKIKFSNAPRTLT